MLTGEQKHLLQGKLLGLFLKFHHQMLQMDTSVHCVFPAFSLSPAQGSAGYCSHGSRRWDFSLCTWPFILQVLLCLGQQGTQSFIFILLFIQAFSPDTLCLSLMAWSASSSFPTWRRALHFQSSLCQKADSGGLSGLNPSQLSVFPAAVPVPPCLFDGISLLLLALE